MKWILATLIFFTVCVYGQSDKLRLEHFNVKKGVAIEGYDPVSYFNGNPVEGKSDMVFTFRGVTYLFVNSSNLNKFKTSPEKYEPAYGGWCAYAMGDSGEKVKIDPETFKILDGRLYLFYNFWGNNTLTDWNKNERKLKQMGDTNWQKFIH
jgi:YHS domain-containing protein